MERIAKVNTKNFGPQSPEIKAYSQIILNDNASEQYLKQHPDLLTEETIQDLTEWNIRFQDCR